MKLVTSHADIDRKRQCVLAMGHVRVIFAQILIWLRTNKQSLSIKPIPAHTSLAPVSPGSPQHGSFAHQNTRQLSKFHNCASSYFIISYLCNVLWPVNRGRTGGHIAVKIYQLSQYHYCFNRLSTPSPRGRQIPSIWTQTQPDTLSIDILIFYFSCCSWFGGGGLV